MLEFRQILWGILVPLACGVAAALVGWLAWRPRSENGAPAGGAAVGMAASWAAVILALCAGAIGLTNWPAWPWELRFRAEHGVLVAALVASGLALLGTRVWRKPGPARDAVLAILIATLGVGLAGLSRLRRDAAWTGHEVLVWAALWGASVLVGMILLWHERAATKRTEGHALAGASSAALFSGVLGASALAIVLAGQSLTLGLITGGVSLVFVPLAMLFVARREARVGLLASVAGLTALSGLWSGAVLWAYLPWWTPALVSAGMAASWLGGLRVVASRGPWAVLAVRVLAAALVVGAGVAVSIVLAAPELQEGSGSAEW